MKRANLFRCSVLLAAATLAACANIERSLTVNDPLKPHSGQWDPNHSNRANLELMVANPADLVRGTGAATSDGGEAVMAVTALRLDKVKQIQTTATSSVGGS
jgi:type IV pilus biogenesis protein CpaD/CtpE